MKAYSVFVRLNVGNYRGYSSYYNDFEDVEIEEYVGSYNSRAAAKTAAQNVDISAYNAAKKNWTASSGDAWTTFAFVFESDINSPVKTDAVSDAADEVAAAARNAWRRSPAGLAYAENQRQLNIAYKVRTEAAKEKRAAEKRAAQDLINAKSRATRAAKKAAAQAAPSQV